VTIVVDGEVTLDEALELDVKVEDTGLVVANELLLNGKLNLLSGAIILAYDVLEVDGDGAKQAQEDDVDHL
jgi:hypothetical protein